MSPSSNYYRDERTELHLGDAAAVLETMQPRSVDCIVTSPPYYGLRDYDEPGQIGAESNVTDYVQNLVRTFRLAREVLTDEGTFWLNIGDSYESSGGMVGVGPNASVGSTKRQATARTRAKTGLPAKNLIGAPWRVALALQADGWILRNAIIWNKPNAMPFSGQDRLANRYEHIFMLAKSPRYYFDLDEIREPHKGKVYNEKGKNPGDVWDIPVRPFTDAHFATFPLDLPERCIRAGAPEDGVVLDPFAGACTTGKAAHDLGRRFVGIELNRDYLDIAMRTRLSHLQEVQS